MANKEGGGYVVTMTRVHNGKKYRTHLLRRSYREEGRVKNETLANLSHLPDELIEVIRRTLRGETFVPAQEQFEILDSRAHGHVQAVRMAMEQLGFQSLLASRASPERDRVCAMVAARVLHPQSKLATTRWWREVTLAEELGVEETQENDLYAAMDWLLERQDLIQRKLADRHLQEGAIALYDLSSSYFEGTCCPLAKLGYSRDGQRGKLQVNYGLLTSRGGCPVAISVHEGNTSDSKTLLPQVELLRQRFKLHGVVVVGDRGMITQAAIKEMSGMDGMDWITALKSSQIRRLVEKGLVHQSMFDEHNLAEISHEAYPDERLMVCRNPDLARLRAYKRQALLEATRKEFAKIQAQVDSGRLQGGPNIGMRLGRVMNKYKMSKHFEPHITDTSLSFTLKQHKIDAEAALDGIYVVRTGLPQERMEAAEAVRTYKALSHVERAFRCLKGDDLAVRPIHHRLEGRVRAHLFLCMLAYYLEWHLREAWRPLLFADEDPQARATRDPVAPARRSRPAQRKASTRRLPDGTPTHSYQTLLADLATLTRNTCRVPKADSGTFRLETTPNALQRRALALISQGVTVQATERKGNPTA